MTYAEKLAAGKDLVAMIHLPALPGTPRSRLRPDEVVARAVREAKLYRDCGFTTVLVENMHDVPYTKQPGPEIPALMAVAARAVKEATGLYCGVQVLAGANREAVAVAHAAGLDFVRVEGFVFGHIGDEGVFDACAGDLLRYRRAIGADEVLVFADIKKKHSSHAITADVDLRATAEAAAFFLADGIVVTGSSTGRPVAEADLVAVRDVPVRWLVVGSGVTPENLPRLAPLADVLIVGSYLKLGGHWENDPDQDRARKLLHAFARATEASALEART